MRYFFRSISLYVLALCAAVAVLLFSIFYLSGSYAYLGDWFLRLGGCFYKSKQWRSDFFTPAVKQAGDRWCIVALGCSLAVIIYCVYRWRGYKPDKNAATAGIRHRITLLPVLLPIGAGIALWLYGKSGLAPAFDEVFSAVNCAGLQPFQTIAYYMLPNNHLFYNLLNGIVFHFFEDKVATGRCISLLAYLGVLVLVYRWLSQHFPSRLLVALGVLLLATQLPAWGFATQARGYELQLLAGWATFSCIFGYLSYKQVYWLRWYSAAVIVGYVTIPTFLFFHFATVVFMAGVQVFEKKMDTAFWKYQVLSLCGIFFFYLPAICFSGTTALSENPYVRAEAIPGVDFASAFIPKFRYYINYCFGQPFGEEGNLVFIVFLLPLVLLFTRNRQRVLLGTFYLIMWTGFVVVVLTMKRQPFARNLIAHYSITLAIVIYSLYVLLEWITARLKNRYIPKIVYSTVLLVAIFQFQKFYRENAASLLYFSPVNEIHAAAAAGVGQIPAGSTVACSDESFYWYYLLRTGNYDAHQCPKGNEDYYVIAVSEKIPERFKEQYLLFRSFRDYMVYRHR